MMQAVTVLPGDGNRTSHCASLGPGLVRNGDRHVRISLPGVLRRESECKEWVDFSKKKYIPVKNERVLGIVAKTGKQHRVDIQGSVHAVLPELAFQGATKRNKPTLQVGQVVYAQITRAHRVLEPEISCVESSGKAGGLGPLDSGYLHRCSLGLCRKLLAEHCTVLQALGKRFKFECVVGMNGLVLVNSDKLVHTIAITNAISSSEFMSEEQCSAMVQQIVDTL